jgi:plastocyanin domain-containing protein
MTTLFVNLAGLVLIGLIVWWFWLSKPKTLRIAAGAVDIVVDGGVYTPSRVEVVAGRPVTLRFVRRDPSPCAEKVLFGELGIAADLAMDKPTEVTLTPVNPGEYEFTCQMRMYRGTLIARAAP